jgi:diguanylate cyclase (GGDEF)-like protein
VTGVAGVGTELLDLVCPFHLVTDVDGTVLRVGPSLARVAPTLRPGTSLDEVATVEARGTETAHPGLRPGPGVLVVLRVTGTDLALRGHVVEGGSDLVFVGSPWVTRLDQLAALGLTVSDFAVSDPVLDHLLLQQVQEHALVQSRQLAAQLQASAEELQRRAQHDELTGLANRASVTRMLRTDEPGQGDRLPVTVLLLDLDSFKDVNGGLGHAVGDEVLRRVAQRLSAVVRSGDTVARLGGDEFVVLLSGVSDASAAVAVTEKLVAAVGQPLVVGGSSLCLGVTVGIAVGGDGDGQEDDEDDEGTLLKRADLAMYRAKEAGVGWAVFDALEDDLAAERVGIIAALRRALETGALTVAYQPVVEPATGTTVAFEALARWYDPDRGQVPPDRFIPVAEQSGLVVPLTRQVLRKALTACAGWREDGFDVGVAVNLSVHAVRRTDVPAMVGEELRRSGVDARHLTIEITEGSLADDGPRLRSSLSALRGLGLTLSIDDFGTGFSSMSYLKRLRCRP